MLQTFFTQNCANSKTIILNLDHILEMEPIREDKLGHYRIVVSSGGYHKTYYVFNIPEHLKEVGENLINIIRIFKGKSIDEISDKFCEFAFGKIKLEVISHNILIDGDDYILSVVCKLGVGLEPLIIDDHSKIAFDKS